MNFLQRQFINLALSFGWKPLLRYLGQKASEYTKNSPAKWDDAIGLFISNSLFVFAEIEDVKINEDFKPKLRSALNKIVVQSENQIDDVLERHIFVLIRAIEDKDYNKVGIIIAQITQEILSLKPEQK